MFCFELEGWAEEVIIKTPFVFIEVIKKVNQLGFVKAVIAQELSDMAPVFLLHMGIIVFSIGTGPGKGDGVCGALGKIPVEMVVQSHYHNQSLESERADFVRCLWFV